MVCNLCGEQEATIHLTEIINGQMIEVHLCEQCAQEKGTDFKTHFNISDLFSGLTQIGAKTSKGFTERRAGGKCAKCGMLYEEFGKKGRLGCPACYDSFARLLLPLIKRIHRSSYHTGKKPAKAAGQVKVTRDLRVLQERLRKSVQAEAFEEAAKLRDEIKKLEDKMNQPKKGKS